MAGGFCLLDARIFMIPGFDRGGFPTGTFVWYWRARDIWHCPSLVNMKMVVVVDKKIVN